MGRTKQLYFLLPSCKHKENRVPDAPRCFQDPEKVFKVGMPKCPYPYKAEYICEHYSPDEVEVCNPCIQSLLVFLEKMSKRGFAARQKERLSKKCEVHPLFYKYRWSFRKI
jgi:hypothetical protein